MSDYEQFNMMPDEIKKEYFKLHIEEISKLRTENASLTDKLHAYEKQWTDMDYTISHLRQENAELRAELLALREMFPTARPRPTQDPATAITYGLYPSSARPVNPKIK